MKKMQSACRTGVVIGIFLAVSSRAADRPVEGPLMPFLGEPRLEIQQVFEGERFPNVVVTMKGTVVVTWGNTSVRARRSEDGGQTWGDEITVANPGFQGGGTTVDETTGDLLAFVEARHPPGPLQVYRSKDDGKTWQEEEVTCHPDVKGNVLSMHMNEHGITLRHGEHRGRLLRPARYYGKRNHPSEWPKHYTSAVYSDDGGKTWHASDPFPENGTGEAAVAELSDGRIYYNSRAHWQERPKNTRRRCAWSYDGAKTWKDWQVVDILPDGHQHRSYGCMGGLVRLPVAGRDILIFSNIDTPNAKRERATVWASFDGGTTWPVKRLVYEGASAYSSLGAGRPDTPSEGWIYLHFESDGAKVARFNLSWLLAGEPTGDGRVPEELVSVRRPNVLFLAVDDMKDWVNCMGGYEGTVYTPNIDRLARRGMLFTNAHCPSPKCAPSRAAIMTGLRPSTTGLYDNSHWWLPNLPRVVTMPAHFRHHGYRVVGAGKIFHHTAGNNPPNQWDDFLRLTFRNDPWFRGVTLNYPWSKPAPYPKGFPFSGVRGLGHENDWGSLGIPEADYDDSLSADYAVRFLQEQQGKPFFLACGLFRPHLPWYVPKKYFDLYPLENIVLPNVREDDLDDLPAEGLKLARARRSDFETIQDANKYKHAVRAYLASISFADAQLGRVLDALDASPHTKDTVIVLWSDHGWHLGEKGHWHKSTLWEEATRVPLIVAAPGFEPGRCSRPVSLIDLYPTLSALCDLPQIEAHDGVSIVPLLRDPACEWNRAAVIEFRRGNAAVRSDRYRYIRYRNGGEELYDLEHDPYEWDNLAGLSDYATLKSDLAQALPKTWADAAPTKAAFTFDPETCVWEHRQSGTITQGK